MVFWRGVSEKSRKQLAEKAVALMSEEKKPSSESKPRSKNKRVGVVPAIAFLDNLKGTDGLKKQSVSISSRKINQIKIDDSELLTDKFLSEFHSNFAKTLLDKVATDAFLNSLPNFLNNIDANDSEYQQKFLSIFKNIETYANKYIITKSDPLYNTRISAQKTLELSSHIIRKHIEDSCNTSIDESSEAEVYKKLKNASFIIHKFKNYRSMRANLPRDISQSLVKNLADFNNSENITEIYKEIHSIKNILDEAKAKLDSGEINGKRYKNIIDKINIFPMPLLLASTEKGRGIDKAVEDFNLLYKSILEKNGKINAKARSNEAKLINKQVKQEKKAKIPSQLADTKDAVETLKAKKLALETKIEDLVNKISSNFKKLEEKYYQKNTFLERTDQAIKNPNIPEQKKSKYKQLKKYVNEIFEKSYRFLKFKQIIKRNIKSDFNKIAKLSVEISAIERIEDSVARDKADPRLEKKPTSIRPQKGFKDDDDNQHKLTTALHDSCKASCDTLMDMLKGNDDERKHLFSQLHELIAFVVKEKSNDKYYNLYFSHAVKEALTVIKQNYGDFDDNHNLVIIDDFIKEIAIKMNFLANNITLLLQKSQNKRDQLIKSGKQVVMDAKVPSYGNSTDQLLSQVDDDVGNDELKEWLSEFANDDEPLSKGIMEAYDNLIKRL